MILGFMRHGKAEPRGSRPDRERRLTPEGREDSIRVARILPFRPSTIYSSPLVRAVETAEAVAEALGGVSVITSELLEPGVFGVESLRELNPQDGSLLVGHAPSIEKVVSALIGGCPVKMGTSYVAILELEEIDRGRGSLLALIGPPSNQ